MKAMLAVSFMFGICSSVFAQVSNPLLSEQEVAIRNLIKKKLYQGGKDDEPIKVQPQLPLVTRKQGPSQEVEAPEEPSSHDAD